MAAGYCYFLGINSNAFFLKDNKKPFILGLNVPKVTAYLKISSYVLTAIYDLIAHDQALRADFERQREENRQFVKAQQDNIKEFYMQ